MCRICYSADAAIDVQLSGKNTLAVAKTSCCGYGSNGMKSSGVFDCIMIPGAHKLSGAKSTVLQADSQCGGKGGLGSSFGMGIGAGSKTVCCK